MTIRSITDCIRKAYSKKDDWYLDSLIYFWFWSKMKNICINISPQQFNGKNDHGHRHMIKLKGPKLAWVLGLGVSEPRYLAQSWALHFQPHPTVYLCLCPISLDALSKWKNTLSESMTVFSLCAIVNTVQCLKCSLIAVCMSASVCASTFAVASSRTKILSLWTIARAKQTSWRSPTLKLAPPSETCL